MKRSRTARSTHRRLRSLRIVAPVDAEEPLCRDVGIENVARKRQEDRRCGRVSEQSLETFLALMERRDVDHLDDGQFALARLDHATVEQHTNRLPVATPNCPREPIDALLGRAPYVLGTHIRVNPEAVEVDLGGRFQGVPGQNLHRPVHFDNPPLGRVEDQRGRRAVAEDRVELGLTRAQTPPLSRQIGFVAAALPQVHEHRYRKIRVCLVDQAAEDLYGDDLTALGAQGGFEAVCLTLIRGDRVEVLTSVVGECPDIMRADVVNLRARVAQQVEPGRVHVDRHSPSTIGDHCWRRARSKCFRVQAQQGRRRIAGDIVQQRTLEYVKLVHDNPPHEDTDDLQIVNRARLGIHIAQSGAERFGGTLFEQREGCGVGFDRVRLGITPLHRQADATYERSLRFGHCDLAFQPYLPHPRVRT